MRWPPRRKAPKMGVRQPTQIRCASHLAWVRGHQCCVKDSRNHVCNSFDRIEAHHVREGADGGTGLKPGDDTAVPLCSAAHARGHTLGWKSFEKLYGVDLAKIAEGLWDRSPHGRKWRAEHG